MIDNYFNAFDNVSLEDLERLASTASMEANALSGLILDSRQRMGQFFRKASTYFSKFQFITTNLSNVLPQDMVGYVGKVGFVDAAQKDVIVPESFTGMWVPYSAALLEVMVQAVKLEGMINEYNQTLGRLVNNPELLKAVSGVGHTGPADLGINARMVKIGQTFFDPKSNHINRPLGTVIERTQDIATTHSNLNSAIALDKSHPAKKSLEAVNRSMALADRLLAYADSTSKNCMQELVNLTLSIAKEMEAYGTLLFRLRQFSESLKDSLKEIKK